MKRLVALVLVVLLAVSACRTGGAGDVTASTPTTTPTPTDATASTAPLTVDSLIVSPGAVGPVQIGMTEAEATATGLFVPAATDDPLECELPAAIAWKSGFDTALDVFTDTRSRLVSIGIYAPGPHTAEGLAVGSTLADVSAVHETAEMTSAGYDQTGVFVTDGDNWLGFLFDATLDDVSPTSTVRFMEVSAGEKPALIRDGC